MSVGPGRGVDYPGTWLRDGKLKDAAGPPQNGTQSDVTFQRTTTGPGSFNCNGSYQLRILRLWNGMD